MKESETSKGQPMAEGLQWRIRRREAGWLSKRETGTTNSRSGQLPLPPAQRRRVAAGWLGSAWLVDQHLVWPVRRPVQVPVVHCLQVCWPTRLLADCRREVVGRQGDGEALW